MSQDKHNSALFCFPQLWETFMFLSCVINWLKSAHTKDWLRSSEEQPFLPPMLMAPRHCLTFISSIKPFPLTARVVKGHTGFSVQWLFPVVMTSRTFSLEFTFCASVSQPRDLHYSHGADQCHSHVIYIIPMELIPWPLFPPQARAGAPTPLSLVSCDKLLTGSPPETRLQVCNSLLAPPPSVSHPRWKVLEIKMFRSAEWARQGLYPVPDHIQQSFTLQDKSVWCCQATNLKASACPSGWKLEEWCFPSFRQCEVCVGIG